MQPLLHFGSPAPRKCNPYYILASRGLEIATPIAFWSPGAQKMQSLLHFGPLGAQKMQPLLHLGPPGLRKCNPYCIFGPRGLENATPIAFWPAEKKVFFYPFGKKKVFFTAKKVFFLPPTPWPPLSLEPR